VANTEDIRLCQWGIWDQRDALLDMLITHEPDCWARQVNEAGIRLVGWTVADFIEAALLEEPQKLGLTK